MMGVMELTIIEGHETAWTYLLIELGDGVLGAVLDRHGGCFLMGLSVGLGR